MREPAGFPQIADGAVVTVGTFDGVHIGHRDILGRLGDRAMALGLPALLVTFRPHPLEVVNPSAAPMLLSPGVEQIDALADSGALLVSVLPFNARLAAMSAEEFVHRILIDRYHVRELVIGYDHGLGRGRHGDASLLTSIGKSHGFTVDVVPAALDEVGIPVSSSVVRNCVAHGELDRAARLLGRPYSFRGTVIPGDQRGRTIGYPTMNIQLVPGRKLLPPEGVYAVRAQTARGNFGGMMNLGPRPTFGDSKSTAEVHLFGVDGDWYGESISVELVRRLRDTVRFEGIEALVKQLGTDAENAKLALTQA
jgi:riboflavin kinase/FMN adenylyltransferase